MFPKLAGVGLNLSVLRVLVVAVALVVLVHLGVGHRLLLSALVCVILYRYVLPCFASGCLGWFCGFVVVMCCALLPGGIH